jgi:hypothetical protein
MPDETRPQLLRAAPYFLSADLLKAATHYEQVLGFIREYTGGEPPEFVIVSRDGLPLMLKRLEGGARLVPNETRGGTWDVFFWVRHLRVLHEELRGRGAQVVYGPLLQPYGVEEFAVRDVDGYILGFGEQISGR